VGDDSGQTMVGNNGGQQWWATMVGDMVGDDSGQQWWGNNGGPMTVGDNGGRLSLSGRAQKRTGSMA